MVSLRKTDITFYASLPVCQINSTPHTNALLYNVLSALRSKVGPVLAYKEVKNIKNIAKYCMGNGIP